MDIKKRTFTYALEIIKFIDQLNKNDLSVQVIARQLLRSGTSIGANVIEAQTSSSKKEFTNFLNHSLKSANESKFWLAPLKGFGQSKKGIRQFLTFRNYRVSKHPCLKHSNSQR
ncbi:MAG: four helix bundle protein [Candidatus Zixiibacteriota bacterium]